MKGPASSPRPELELRCEQHKHLNSDFVAAQNEQMEVSSCRDCFVVDLLEEGMQEAVEEFEERNKRLANWFAWKIVMFVSREEIIWCIYC